MRKTTMSFLLVAVALTGCPSNNNNRDTGTVNPGTDSGVDAANNPGMDSGMDAGPVMGTDVSLASVVNPSPTDHPSDGDTIHVTDSLVALSTRLFVSQSDPPANRCLFTVWVGTAAGGDYSGIQVTETFEAPVDGCFDAVAHQIPDTINIGDTVTNLTGRFINFRAAGTTQPPNTAQEIDVTNGTFTVGGAGTAVTATDVEIVDIAGVGLTVGDRGMALQGALVHLTDVVVFDPPSATNHNVMTVSATGTTDPIMPIQVSKYGGVGCQRTVLTAMARGASVGDVTGVLQYSFGQWTIQLRAREDIPGIACPDAGMGADAGP